MHTRTKSVPVTEIKAVIRQFRTLSQQKIGEGEHYRLDRGSAGEYMAYYDKLAQKVSDFLRSLHAAREPIVYVDICGRAQHAWADFNYSFSLQPNRWEWEKIPRRVEGDLFSMKDFYRFLRMIKSNGHRPSFVTCVPVAGLNEYTVWANKSHNLPRYENVLYQRLENNLRATIKVLRPGGFIFLAQVLQGSGVADFLNGKSAEQWSSSLWLKSLCKEMRCSVEIDHLLGGNPVYLIRKWLR